MHETVEENNFPTSALHVETLASQKCCCHRNVLSFDSQFMDSGLPSPQAHSTLCSTPVSATSLFGFQTPDPEAMRRIKELEDELQRMRQQIALVVAQQESSVSVAPITPGRVSTFEVLS